MALMFTTLVLSAAGPVLVQPHLVWVRVLYASGYHVSVGEMGVFVVGGLDARRYDFNGNLIWTSEISIGEPERFFPSGVAVGFDGIYAVGIMELELEPHGAFSGVVFVSKLDFDGHLVWQQFLGIANQFPSVSAHASGIYATGDNFVEKLDANGNKVWRQDTLPAMGVSAGPRGVYIVGKGFMSALSVNGNELWTRLSGGNQVSVAPNGIYTIGSVGPDWVLTKYDLNATQLWQVASGPVNTIPWGVTSDQGGAYVVGLDYGKWPFGAFVQHVDSNGSTTWSLILRILTDGDVPSGALSTSISTRGIFVAGTDFVAKVCSNPSCINGQSHSEATRR